MALFLGTEAQIRRRRGCTALWQRQPESGAAPWSPGTWARGHLRAVAKRVRPHRSAATPVGPRRNAQRSAGGRADGPWAAFPPQNSCHTVTHLPRCCSLCPPGWVQAPLPVWRWRTCRPDAGPTRSGRVQQRRHWPAPGAESKPRDDNNGHPRWRSFPCRPSCRSDHPCGSHPPLQREREREVKKNGEIRELLHTATEIHQSQNSNYIPVKCLAH